MLVLCFAGCSQKSDEDAAADISDEASDSALTLAMYLLCESEVSAEQAAKIETAVNKITKSKFKTQLKLYFYTEDKYYEALEASFAARRQAEEDGLISDTPATGKGEDETIINADWGITEIKYPTIDSYQVDIFYLGGLEKFTQYKEEDWLAKLDDELSHDSKLISDYIAPEYLTYMKKINSNATYAIPNNAPVGKYQYLLLNKKVLEDTRYNTDAGIAQFTSFTCDAVDRVLSQIDTTKYPIYSSVGADGLALSGWKYWGVDENGVLCSDFSVYGCEYPDAEYLEKDKSFLVGSNNVIANANFQKAITTLKKYAAEYTYTNEIKKLEEGDVSVAYLEGTTNIPVEYSDKYVVIEIGTPIIETEDLYRNMFAVCSYSTSVNRSMEIITYLNTNEEFRNILVYGIEGENYELVDYRDKNMQEVKDENGKNVKVVRRMEDNTYFMDPEKVGNSLIGHTLEGENPLLKYYYKRQNANLKVSLTMGFVLKNASNEVNVAWLQGLRTLSIDVLDQIKKADYKDVETAEFWKNLSDYVTKDPNYGPIIAQDTSGNYVTSLYQMYENWGVGMGIYDPSAAE